MADDNIVIVQRVRLAGQASALVGIRILRMYLIVFLRILKEVAQAYEVTVPALHERILLAPRLLCRGS